MITNQKQPLELASSILQPRTLELVRRADSIHSRGWKILDRWAFNSPETLKRLEAQGEVLLLERLQIQQDMEQEVLTRNLEQYLQGVSEMEILEQEAVPTELLLD